jgi:hypothetical protein
MQSLKWYLKRFQSMSPNEIIWRLQSKIRDNIDRLRFPLGLYPALKDAIPIKSKSGMESKFRVSDIEIGEWASAKEESDEYRWYTHLLQQADEIVRNRITFFNLRDHYLGDPIDWNKDHGSGKRAPMQFAPSIDYRDYRITGDCKFVWELNRHHHLVILGRAYRASGNVKYAMAAIKQLETWLDQCPFGRGMNWRSPLELGIRLINWVWALDLLKESGVYSEDFQRRIVHSVYLHLWEISRKYSRGSSANNHLIGEAAGVFIATCYFKNLRNGYRWQEESREILSREIIVQSYPDGCTHEQAIGYHLFVLQFFLIAGIVAKGCSIEFPPEYWARLEKMLEFLGKLTEGGASLPIFGDCDDGYVLDLGGDRGDYQELLAAGAVLFGRSDFKRWAGKYPEACRWLLGKRSRERFQSLEVNSNEPDLTSHAFPESGYYLLQCGNKRSKDHISVLFDCGELGFKSIAAHGHADALSFSMRAFDRDVFIDPGTYDYFSFPDWRNYFRSTRAHNAVMVDDLDQSVMLGPFLWGEKAQARCLRWEPHEQGGIVMGEHNGYTRLPDPVSHRRTLYLDNESKLLTIKDEIITEKSHRITICFHLSETVSLSQIGSNIFELKVNPRGLRFELDSGLKVHLFRGEDNPIWGWMSKGYHQKVPALSIIGQAISEGRNTYTCKVSIAQD